MNLVISRFMKTPYMLSIVSFNTNTVHVLEKKRFMIKNKKHYN